MKSEKDRKIQSIDGLDIYYWLRGSKNADKNLIVLHPGSSMNHTILRPLEAILNEMGFPTLNLDPRGCGYSDIAKKASGYNIDFYEDDLDRILNKENIYNPIFIGHSSGFMVMAHYLARTDNAESFVGICASPKFKDTAVNIPLYLFFNWVLRYGEYAGHFAKKIQHKLRKESWEYPDFTTLKDATDMDLWWKIVDSPFPRIRANKDSGRIICDKWDVYEDMHFVDKKMLLIYGDDNKMVTTKAGDIIEGLVRDPSKVQKVILHGWPHSLPYKNPKEVANEINKFYMSKK